MSLWNKITERFPNANLSKFSKTDDNVQCNLGNGDSKHVFDKDGNFNRTSSFTEEMNEILVLPVLAVSH